MKKFSGFKQLLEHRNDLPQTGWIFVDKHIKRTSAEDLSAADFFVPENDDDEFYGEDNLATIVEAPIFCAILELREKKLTNPTIDQYLAAVVHYLEYDAFLE